MVIERANNYLREPVEISGENTHVFPVFAGVLNMCSGCSGNYTGGYEEPGDGSPNEETQSLPGSRGAGAGAVRAQDDALKAPPQGPGIEGDQSRNLPYPTHRNELAWEVGWEVLVSAERIIEIYFLRMVPDNSINGSVIRAGGGPTTEEQVAVGQHSRRWSARNYATPNEHAFSGARRSSIRLLYLGLGALTAAVLAAWMLLG
jgi:hypothetical protein